LLSTDLQRYKFLIKKPCISCPQAFLWLTTNLKGDFKFSPETFQVFFSVQASIFALNIKYEQDKRYI